MFEDIINYIGEIALRHKAVRSFQYKKRIKINAQNNTPYMQVIVEDNSYLQLIKTNNVFTCTLNIDILGQPKDETQILEVQNDALTVAVNIMAYIERDITYKGMLSIYDYDMLMLSEFTDDRSAGVRLSLELVLPIPIDLCTLDDNFNDEVEIVEPDDDIDLPQIENKSDELILTPIKLQKNKK